ncbi:hypothetical protein WMF38_54290 [Sorangium sp. So ce118]
MIVANRSMKIPSTIARALRLLVQHPNVQRLGEVALDAKTGVTTVFVYLRVSLPNAWMASGVSPNGIRAVETITLAFPRSYPIDPPKIHLRADFERSLAHIQPGALTEAPVPCIYDGDLREFFQRQGIAGVMNQLVVWLENAALDRLIDPSHGWEPVRRDSLTDFVVADGRNLRALVSHREDHAIFRLFYWRGRLADGCLAYHAAVDPVRINLKQQKHSDDVFAEGALDAGRAVGQSLAIVAWPPIQNKRQPAGAKGYQPETVVDVGSLLDRADAYGCVGALRSAIDRVKVCFLSARVAGPFPLVIVLVARRPFAIIGSDSNLELCPYLVEIEGRQFFSKQNLTPVRPTGHHHAISVPLLRGMSGDEVDGRPRQWVQVGAGGLGSKIALHLARAGRAPAVVIDKQTLSPHNVARHGLLPLAHTLQLSWMGSKAHKLAEAISGLGQKADAQLDDVTAILRDPRRIENSPLKNSWAIVNSTASLAVRDAFTSTARDVSLSRVIETSLFAGGRIGLVTVEGPTRNPDTGDLIAEAYDLLRQDARFRDLVFSQTESVQRRDIGEGCGSATAVMTDARISMFAASMAECITEMQRTKLPDTGRILIGALGSDNVSLVWTTHNVLQRIIVDVDGASGWRVRVSERANQNIKDDVLRWPSIETGGILVGRVSEAAQTFYITDVLPAPEDCYRSAGSFVLGTRGVRSKISAYAESCNSSLYCLGTWHSHLNASGPSLQDRATAKIVAYSRLVPSVFLIYTPAGYRALIAED